MNCFFRISMAGAPPKTVVFELYTDKCPITCNNFLSICRSKSSAKRSAASSKADSSEIVEPTYRGTEIHRIVPNFMIQGGDFTSFDGKGGYAHPSSNSGQPTFPDENFSISHTSEGILSMANRGKNTNGSQFFITLNKCLHLDGKHVAFGKVVEGMEVVRDIAMVETEDDRPVKMQRVVIVDCGEGWGKELHNGSTSSDSSKQSERHHKKKHKHKKRHKRNDEKKHRKHSKRLRRDKDYGSSDDESREQKKKKRRKEKRERRKSYDDSSLSDSDGR